MKASEIITDDIVSRERRRTRDVYDKKTTSQDYFGNRKDKQKDRELVSKEKNKERKKEWFEEGNDPCWKGYKQVGMKKKNGRRVPNGVPGEGVEESFSWHKFFPLLEMSERMELLENYFTSNRNLLESNDKHLVKQFLNLRHYSAKPVTDQRFVVTLISLIDNKFRMIEAPEVITFVEKNGNEYIVRDSNNNLKKFPSDYVKEVVIAETIFFDTTESYDDFRSMIGVTFSAGMPDTDVDSLLNKSVEEASMQAAAHKKSGPKFGGYYGATQRGAPKPGQGFGGAAE